MDVDLVLLAKGFIHAKHDGLVKKSNLNLDSRGNLERNKEGMTSSDQVFVAGNAHLGASLIVNAIQEGRELVNKIKYIFNKKIIFLKID